jgi:hypothetical protein
MFMREGRRALLKNEARLYARAISAFEIKPAGNEKAGNKKTA